MLARLRDNETVLLDAYRLVTQAVLGGYDSEQQAVNLEQNIAPTEAWLLDNFYLIEQQVSLARRHLPRGYSRQLPQLAEGALAGFPRVYELAQELIAHQDGRLDRENTETFIAAYQQQRQLKLGELWAFPIMLRLALLENLRRVASRIAGRRRDREAAANWSERMLGAVEQGSRQLIQVLAEFANANVALTASFIEEFSARLQAQGQSMAFVQTWVDQQLAEQGVSAPQLLQAACHGAAAAQISIANSIGSLRFIGSMDWCSFIESLSFVEHALREDPAAVHALQDFATRDRYRHVVEEVSSMCEFDELSVAQKAVRLARQAAEIADDTRGSAAHVGYYLVGDGRSVLEQALSCRLSWRNRLSRSCGRIRLEIYIGIISLLTLIGTAATALVAYEAGASAWIIALVAPFALVGASALSVAVINLLVTALVPPRVLPRLDFSTGIPDEHRTMVVVPTLLKEMQDIDALLEALEIRYLGNRDPNLYFALLTDFADAPEQHMPSDALLLEHARAGIEALNEAYRSDRPGIFYLFHRPRLWNEIEQRWMGYERKRGKLEQFNALLRAEPDAPQTAFIEIVGDTSRLPSVKYVITLDTDTQLPRDAAQALVGSKAHPLNLPRYDAVKERMVDGYAILQPRASASLASACKSWFSRIFAGDVGLDPYTQEVSDVYQDLFGEGSFIGKGIYDVDAFRQALEGRFPENLILSHDLIESAYARSALVADVDLIEEHPASYVTETSRRHRWMRGDWQIAPWLLPRVPLPAGPSGAPRYERNPLSALSRWKIFDNLRRSLVTPALCGLLVVGWLAGVGPAWVWILSVEVVLFVPPVLEILVDLLRKPGESGLAPHAVLTAKSALRPLLRAVLALIMLPYEAYVSLHAIVQSGLRMLFTRRGLMIWHIEADARRNARCTLAGYYREMWQAPVFAGLAAAALAVWHADQLQYCMPLLALWMVSPAAAWRVSQPLAPAEADLVPEQREFLRMLARKTWRYFAQFVGPEDNWLPPDNFQEHPEPVIASRTSPTNIGMALLTIQAAWDFGYVAGGELLARIEHMFATMQKLERYHGHFLNWYDTRSLQPLIPQYVSSVDSGNLIGSLITLKSGLLELKDSPVLSPLMLQGLDDTLQVLMQQLSVPGLSPGLAVSSKIKELREALAESAGIGTPSACAALLRQVRETAIQLAAMLGTGEPHYWAEALAQQAAAMLEELLLFVPEPQSASRFPTLHELIKQESFAASKLAPVGFKPETVAALDRIRRIDELCERCRDFADMDFSFLYDDASGLLSIGYNVSERRRDPACYDLLASEARLASFLLIAQGRLPQKHWFALGRMLTSYHGDLSLISWSGSMFEYLMPQLVMPDYEDTLLHQTCRTAVARQIEYGRQRGIPWGISESCYNATDMHSTYQYRAFGVPGLGFKRGLADDLVIAPYATALALTVMPTEACNNLKKLVANGFLGPYGLYEAIDYTPSRVQPGMRCSVVRAFMAHHQGMSLLAFTHVLLGQPMQRRFLADPLVKTAELLLQERLPKKSETFALSPHAAEVSAAARPASLEEGAAMRVISDPNLPLPEVHLLSNSRYHLVATHAGGGYSHWQGIALTRWREDAVQDHYGPFIYLRDRYTGRYWSTAWQPTHQPAERYEAIFLQGRAEYRRHDEGIDAHTEVCVATEDDVEIRRVKLTNMSGRLRHIEVTSYAEVVLAPLNADLAHRAFSNLFVQTEILPDRQAILCTRRPRTPGEEPPWMFHLMAAPGVFADDPTFETDRAKFIGRGRTTANPLAFEAETKGKLSNSAGCVLDPIVAIRRVVTLAPDETAGVLVITGIAATRDAALDLAAKYADRSFAERAFDMAWFQSQESLRQLGANEFEAQAYDRLAASMIFAHGLRRAPPALIARNRLGQSGLWRFGISGDLPIVLVRISDQGRIDIVRQAIQAHAYWRLKGLSSDLVILNEDFSGYRAVLNDLIMGLINTSPDAPLFDKHGGIFVRRAEELSEEERVLFQAAARVVLSDAAGFFTEQVERRTPRERLAERRRGWRLGTQQRRISAEHTPQPLVPLRQPQTQIEQLPPLQTGERRFFNGWGGFSSDGREYVITLEPGQATPAPWANVIASPHIGTVVSEAGSAYTWADNAHEFRITPFHNDPVSDTSGEALYLRDEETGQYWSPAPWPARGRTGYLCRHGFGYSTFEHTEAGIASELMFYVALDAPVKFAVLRLRNQSAGKRRISLWGYWELVLGEWRHLNHMHITTEIDPQTGALFARNEYCRECAHRVVFVQTSETERAISGSRAEFIGRNGSLAQPLALRHQKLSGRIGAGLDPCAAFQVWADLDTDEEREVVFILGAACDADEARTLVNRYAGRGGAWQAREAAVSYWRNLLGAVQMETPDPALDLLANGWLLYQVVSCRLWGRSGYYQSGGAYGFRDQLQDTLALLHAEPQLTREQLLRCAGRQFVQGDVQHWWHPPGGQGVRTHFSDDYLWLPYAVCRYVAATGDESVLDENVHFLEGRPLGQEEEAYYDHPLRSAEAASLYEHCVRAIKHGLRFGAHGLPLIGCGDWNDGMNLVGRQGRGESVWLAWFLLENLKLFAALAQRRGDDDFASSCRAQAEQLRLKVEAQAWDGAWYRRAYFDDGAPMGSSTNEECQIDSISQSWAVISGEGDPDRMRRAMAALYERLVRHDAGLILLLAPPFDHSSQEPGYIKGYPPGVRENGGQYTHAAIWAAMAFAMMGERGKAWEFCAMLNPVLRGGTPETVERYRVEPYVMCADIYGEVPHVGRGGWSWYTGAAGWMYRFILETLLGLRLEASHLHIMPRMPLQWPTYVVRYRYQSAVYLIRIRNGGSASKVLRIVLDGATLEPAPEPVIPLSDDGREHGVEVELD